MKYMSRILSCVVAAAIFLTLGGCAPKERKLADYPLAEPFITNVLKESKMVLKCSVTLKVYDDITTETLNENISALRDAIIKILRKKDKEMLSDPDITELLSLEITEALNGLMDTTSFNGVDFTEFYTA